jgi:two-component system phosphate regulon response regulator PhoB
MATRFTALIVEDEQDIADLVRFHLQREGISATHAKSGRRALDLVHASVPDIVILDLMLPDLSGLDVCRKLRAEESTRTTPIVMLTAKGGEADIVAGLEAGADDYVTKPFSAKVLIARLRNALRRRDDSRESREQETTLFRLNDRLVIDLGRHKVACDGNEIALTITEFSMLAALARRPGFVRTRDQIIATVHGPNTVLSQRTIDVHITAIRKKLGELGDAIETVRGVGYRLSDLE